eukprot:CAMPEP_0196582580 /NCGR_PEP_ID=MMETSP1081-20130531/39593_1 /TAXON_ID=36882 /ORGANISM="Pyramimonas amylifera, Strain CCMP720" /LENGTH=362 /DNA_ID=CAMNT_0041903193 /DNA_START=183 /DNA_END=1271 /DNA_ORIENTATION=+
MVKSVQDSSKCVEYFMLGFSAIGDVEFYVTFIPTLFLSVKHRFALRFSVLLVSNLYISGFLKQAFHEPRPTWYSTEIEGKECAEEYGSPSGHAQTAACIYAFLAIEILLWGKMRWIEAEESRKNTIAFMTGVGVLACGVLIPLIGISRVYLQAHFPHQVLLGWLVGLLVTFSFRELECLGELSIEGTPLPLLVAACGAMQSLLLGIAAGLFLTVELSWSMPQEWKDVNHITCPDVNIDQYSALRQLALAAGLGPTLLVVQGVRSMYLHSWDGSWGGWSSAALCAEKVTRAAIAVVVTSSVFLGMGIMIPSSAPLLVDLMFNYFLRGMVAIVALLVAVPALCLELKLLRPNANFDFSSIENNV